jgi:hypothetical protein
VLNTHSVAAKHPLDHHDHHGGDGPGGAHRAENSRARVASIPDHNHSSGMSLFGVASDYLLASGDTGLVEAPSSAPGSPVVALLIPTDITLPPPEPPPRLPVAA